MQVSAVAHWFGPELESMPRLAEAGYRRLEVTRKQDAKAAAADIRALAGRLDLQVHSVMCWNPGIADGDDSARRQAYELLLDNIAWAADLGAGILETVPMWKGDADERPAAWERAVTALQRAGQVAAERGVTLVIEPVNRWETSLVNTLAEGARMAAEVGLPSVKLMGDTFHMHLCERDLCAAIRQVAPLLAHFHFSDNDRLCPGLGLMELPRLVNTLAEVGYTGSLSLSEVNRRQDPYLIAGLGLRYTQALIDAAEARVGPLAPPK